MITQKTLRNEIRASGIGLHTGRKSHIAIRPAPPSTGISFVRKDLDSVLEIAASVESVVDTTLSTTIGHEEVTISTIEHLMAAFSGLGVDNALVEVDGPEIPIMDGSAAPFVFLIQSAGLVEQPVAKQFIKIQHEIGFRDIGSDAHAGLQPSDDFSMKFRIEYDHPVFCDHADYSAIDFSQTTFIKNVSRARTFGFLADYERLKSMNLARGGSFDNTLVIGENSVLNEEGLRLKDEFVKHKVLDAIGDLYLLGHNVIGTFIGHRSGHRTNYQLVKSLLESPQAWEYVTFETFAELPAGYRDFYEEISAFPTEEQQLEPIAVAA